MEQVYDQTKSQMTFKGIDFFDVLTEKERDTVFYPSLALHYGKAKGYDSALAFSLAELAQLLYYSIEIHEKIINGKGIKNLVVLEGDYLYARVFEKITNSEHFREIHRFIDYVKSYSEKKIMHIDGLLAKEELVAYKYGALAAIVVDIIDGGDQAPGFPSEPLSHLHHMYLENAENFIIERNHFLKEQEALLADYPALFQAVSRIALDMGRKLS